MFKKIIDFSIKNKLIILAGVLGLIFIGIYSIKKIPIDAIPDITNNQVQIVTNSPKLAPQEVEKFITYPLENSLRTLPEVKLVRSISRFGLSIITVIFDDDLPILKARQYVKEQIDIAKEEIPDGLGEPELMPITTGLGEIYQYILKVKPGYENQYNVMELRTIQNWIVQRQLAGIPGVIETSSFGGYLKQYEIAVNPNLLQSFGLSLNDVYESLNKNNQNSGSGYIQKGHNAFYIRTEGMIKNLDEVNNIFIAQARDGTPINIRDIGKVKLGFAQRFGAMTMDGKGEVVGGIALMFKDANTHETIARIKERVKKINESLPKGVEIYPYLERTKLINKAISTVEKNLIEGGLIVIFVLVLILGNIRAGLIVSSVIPLSLLFALTMMKIFGVSANLLSMGAIDFGIVVDGAVIIVESVLHVLYGKYLNRKLTQKEMDSIVSKASGEIYQSAAFGVLIILVVFVPIMTLRGIEGKMFRPMAQTVSFAILGAFILSLTYVPVMLALFANKNIQDKVSFSERLINRIKKGYLPVLKSVLQIPRWIAGGAIGLMLISILIFRSTASEFIPTLEEGDLAMQLAVKAGSSLNETIATTDKIEKILKREFPEVKHVVSKIGTAEISTDPMSIEEADIIILLKEKNQWLSALTREELAEKMKEKLRDILGIMIEFSQPIQLRFNELIAGEKSDVVIKIFGEDLDKLKKYADQATEIIQEIPGAADVHSEQIAGLKQLQISYNREKMAQHGLNVFEVNQMIQASNSGIITGVIFEGEKRFNMVVRLDERYRNNFSLDQLFIKNSKGLLIPLSEIASIKEVNGPNRISRENAQRRIYIGVNIRNGDVSGLVGEIQGKLEKNLSMDAGYYITYGGAFENLKEAQTRLSIAIPTTLFIIIFLLYLAFNSVKYAIIIFSAVPMAAIGGIFSLWIRSMPFSISAGVGFIALFGVAVLNGIVMIQHLNDLKNQNTGKKLIEIISQGALDRLRPVLITATVAILGFLPMAASTSDGAEVQRPLATVVIGGLITSTLLTIFVLPMIYYWFEKKSFKIKGNGILIITALLLLPKVQFAQKPISLKEALTSALQNHPSVQNAKRAIMMGKTEKKYAFSLGNSSANFQYGQMNSGKNDYQFSIVQDLGNLFSIKSKKALGQAKIDLAKAELTLLERDLTKDVTQAYYRWLYLYEKHLLFTTTKKYYEKAVDRINIRYKSGESDFIEKGFLQAQIVAIFQQEADIEKLLLDTEAELKQLCFFTEEAEITPGEVFRKKSSLKTMESRNFASILLAPEEKRTALATTQIQRKKADLQPSIQLGYMGQSLDKINYFNTALIEISIPLLDRSLKKQIEEAKIEKETTAYNMQLKKKILETSFESLKKQHEVWENNLKVIGDNYLEELKKLRKAIQLKYLKGETDYISYNEVLQTAIQSELTYFDLINEYNQTLISLEYFN